MQLKCTCCGKKKIVKPAHLKRNGTKIEEYKCRDCYVKHPNINKIQDGTAYDKLVNLAEKYQNGGKK